ncbi:MAG: hypothetical protein ACI31W_02405 [Lactococcus sp.]
MNANHKKEDKKISFETDLISPIMSGVILIVGFLINVKSYLLVAFGIFFAFYCIQTIVRFRKSKEERNHDI